MGYYRILMKRFLGRGDLFPWLIALIVIVSRVLTTGPVYFVDGPEHVDAALTRNFLMPAPPGYWLFNRVAGFFSNPEFGISLMNWTFSAAGVVIFYYAARLLVRKGMARLGCGLYGTVFYCWFSGDIHSTYASQLAFPILVFFLLLLHERQPRMGYLIGAALAFAVGAGLRPSDGAFLGPMLIYYLYLHASRRQAIVACCVAALACLSWLLPTLLLYRSAHGLHFVSGYLATTTTNVSPLTLGMTRRSLANIARVAVPLAMAFWPIGCHVLMSVRRLGDARIRLLWLWVTPGVCFFLMIHMGDAPYLNFVTAALLLLAMKEMEIAATSPRWAYSLLAGCLTWNLLFFLGFKPLSGGALAVDAVNVYAGKYTRYGIDYQWQPRLSDLHEVSLVLPANRQCPRGL